jgi:putative hemolysin
MVVIEKNSQRVVGTYRLLLRSTAKRQRGFYSETEFDLKSLKKNCRGEMLEMGRACVDPAFRKYPVVQMLWKEIILFAQRQKVKYILGCASFSDPTPENIGRVLKFFRKDYYAALPYRVKPLKEKRYPYDKTADYANARQLAPIIPSLIKGYLRMGSRVCGEPVWDRIFNTADFFMLLNMREMNMPFAKRFLSL